MERKVILLSGINFTGKTWHEKHVIALPEADAPVLVDMDVIRANLYGTRPDKHITKTEHLYKNECVRNEVLRHLVLGAQSVMVNSVMQTRRLHQKPFVDMIRRASDYVSDIEREQALHDFRDDPEAEVTFRPVVLYCSLDVLKSRIARKGADRRESKTLVFDLAAMSNSVLPYEHPVAYSPLYLDTSDESAVAHASRIEDLQAYLSTGIRPADHRERREQMIAYHEDICAAVRAAVKDRT